MDQRERRLHALVAQVAIIAGKDVGHDQALVDDGAARHRDRIVGAGRAAEHLYHPVGHHLAGDEELALELSLVADQRSLADEQLAREGLRLLDARTQDRIIDRDIAPAENLETLLAGGLPPAALALL